MGEGPDVLIVDDDAALSKTLADILKAKGYAPLAVGTAQEALSHMESSSPLVAVLDLRLPDMGGLELLQGIKARSPRTECIVLTGYASESSAIEAINLGAYSYIRKPYDVEQLLLTIRRAAEKRAAERALRESEQRYRDLVENANDIIYTHDLEGNFTSANSAVSRLYGYAQEEIQQLNIDQIVDPAYLSRARQSIREKIEGVARTEPYELLTRAKNGEPIWVEVSTRIMKRGDRPPEVEGIARDITDRKRAEEEVQRTVETLHRILEQTVYALAAAVETRDPYTAGHQRRVANLAYAMAREMSLPHEQSRGIYMAGLIHDVGKIQIPAEILSKPSQLTDAEWRMIRSHPQAGSDILQTIEFPWPVAQIVLQHHERIDGSGYPRGLTGEQMLLDARVLAVADVLEAMVSHRPYRPGHALSAALREIETNKGTLYEPDAVEACLQVVEQRGTEFGLK